MRSLTRFDAGDASDHFTSYQLDGSIEHYRGGDGNRELGFGSVERALETALTSKEGSRRANYPMRFPRGSTGHRDDCVIDTVNRAETHLNPVPNTTRGQLKSS